MGEEKNSLFEKHKSKRRLRKNKLAQKSADYAQGYNDASGEFIEDIKDLTNQLTESSKNSLIKIKELQHAHDSNLKYVKIEWEENCSSCKSNMKSDKDRAVSLQNKLRDSIDKFQILINKLMSIAALTKSSAESAAKLSTLTNQLDSLSAEASLFVENNKNTLEKMV